MRMIFSPSEEYVIRYADVSVHEKLELWPSISLFKIQIIIYWLINGGYSVMAKVLLFWGYLL